MMAAMSHDLRIPLTRLRLRIEMAEGLEDQQKMLDELDTLVDLSALVEGSCEDAVDAGEKAAFSGPRDVTISCRPTAMRRAISNLVDNAVKHGGKADGTLAPEAES
jgi:signal transduction histidine kinase